MSDRRVGLIGCGRIGRDAHLPAYRKYGVSVTAVCDLDRERALLAAEQFERKSVLVFTDPLELAACDNVDLIDVATPQVGRIALLRELLNAKKPLLVQKPVSYSSEEVEQLATAAESANVPVAVNHNARWAPVHVRLHQLIESGELGAPFAISHVNRFNEDQRTWYTDHPDYLFLDHGLHYLDLLRWHTGLTPLEVSALSRRAPKQMANCPLLYSIQLRFSESDAPLATLVFNNAVPGPSSYSCDWFFDGTHGSAHLTLDTISFVSRGGDVKFSERPDGGWVPDGFHGAYQAFADFLDFRTTLPHSLRDHAQSLRFAEAAAASARLGGTWVAVKRR
jgi:predicted dehydrogenase